MSKIKEKILTVSIVLVVSISTSSIVSIHYKEKEQKKRTEALNVATTLNSDVDYIKEKFGNFILTSSKDRIYTGWLIKDDNTKHNFTYDSINKIVLKDEANEGEETNIKTYAHDIVVNEKIVETDYFFYDLKHGFKWGTRMFPGDLNYLNAKEYNDKINGVE